MRMKKFKVSGFQKIKRKFTVPSYISVINNDWTKYNMRSTHSKKLRNYVLMRVIMIH